jgi:prepilin peptidase CpaA
VELPTKFLLLAVAIPCGVSDARFTRIPNAITLAGIAAGFVLAGFLHGSSGLLLSAEGLGIALAIYLPLYLLRALAAGDVKLAAAIASIAGWGPFLRIFLISAIGGGVAALVLIVVRGRFARTLANIGQILGSLLRGRLPYKANEELDVRTTKGLRLPHGVLLACAAVLYVTFF